MGRTQRTQVALYLDADRVELLKQLADKTGKTQQDVLRLALDSMLVRHKLLKRKTIVRRQTVLVKPADA